jgi:hypothetical protein
MTRRLAWLRLLSVGLMLAAGGASGAASAARATGVASVGNLDCNGLSAIQRPVKPLDVCGDFLGYDRGRGIDDGRYVGHDEAAIMFNSTVPGSGSNVQWSLELPRERPLPAIQSFEDYVAFRFAMALCDPDSFPQNPCTPASDTNTGVSIFTSSGAASLELLLFPPGMAAFPAGFSCDTTHWCAALTVNSVECTAGFEFCNPDCTEPQNWAFVQRDGVPTGPPGPADATDATFTPNAETLLLDPGDAIQVTTKDTPHGVLSLIDDLTTGQSGFMVASAANGFEHTDVDSCAATPFSFRPEYSTAKVGNWVAVSSLQLNVGFAMELGHFEPGAAGDGDGDDAPCFPGPVVPGCLAFAEDGDLDFDGPSYVADDWPDGTTSTPEPVLVDPPHSAAGNSGGYVVPYDRMQFETDVPASDAGCTLGGAGCVVPPGNGAFYPFYSATSAHGRCAFLFGNDVPGLTANDFGRDAEWGTPNLAWFFGTLSSGIRSNPCHG